MTKAMLTDLELQTLRLIAAIQDKSSDRPWQLNNQGEVMLYGQDKAAAQRLKRKGLVRGGVGWIGFKVKDAGRKALEDA